MKQQYEILTTIRYRHAFFRTLSYEGIGLRVPPATGKQLLNADLVVKQQATGAVLLYNALAAGKRTRDDILQDQITLTFDVVLKDPAFYNYTQVDAADIAAQCFIFSNDAGNAPGVLHQRSYAGAEDLHGLNTLAETFFVKPFGQLILQLKAPLQETYDICFQARSTYRCYYLMSSELASLANPVILDSNGAPFSGTPVLTELPDKSKVPVLISDKPVALTERGPDIFRLADRLPAEDNRHKIIISRLPAPEISRISAAGKSWQTNDKAYSEIFLY